LGDFERGVPAGFSHQPLGSTQGDSSWGYSTPELMGGFEPGLVNEKPGWGSLMTFNLPISTALAYNGLQPARVKNDTHASQVTRTFRNQL
jgi:hypothetical protein